MSDDGAAILARQRQAERRYSSLRDARRAAHTSTLALVDLAASAAVARAIGGAYLLALHEAEENARQEMERVYSEAAAWWAENHPEATG